MKVKRFSKYSQKLCSELYREAIFPKYNLVNSYILFHRVLHSLIGSLESVYHKNKISNALAANVVSDKVQNEKLVPNGQMAKSLTMVSISRVAICN